MLAPPMKFHIQQLNNGLNAVKANKETELGFGITGTGTFQLTHAYDTVCPCEHVSVSHASRV